jgi:hypothetical protein
LEKHDLLNNGETTPNIQFFTNTEVDTLQWLLGDFSEAISVEKRDF